MESYYGMKYDDVDDKDLNDNILKDWTHIWDYDFELDNFEPEEIQKAIIEVCDMDIPLDKIKYVYDESKNGNKIGIKSLSEDVIEKHKIDINKKALENLIKHYNETQDDSILKRPIFKLIENLLNIAYTNYPPKDTNHSLELKKVLYGAILENKSVFKHID